MLFSYAEVLCRSFGPPITFMLHESRWQSINVKVASPVLCLLASVGNTTVCLEIPLQSPRPGGETVTWRPCPPLPPGERPSRDTHLFIFCIHSSGNKWYTKTKISSLHFLGKGCTCVLLCRLHKLPVPNQSHSHHPANLRLTGFQPKQLICPQWLQIWGKTQKV